MQESSWNVVSIPWSKTISRPYENKQDPCFYVYIPSYYDKERAKIIVHDEHKHRSRL